MADHIDEKNDTAQKSMTILKKHHTTLEFLIINVH
jgi:hypothetical protein